MSPLGNANGVDAEHPKCTQESTSPSTPAKNIPVQNASTKVEKPWHRERKKRINTKLLAINLFLKTYVVWFITMSVYFDL